MGRSLRCTTGRLVPFDINWPNSETWAVLTVQQNQICFFNGLMVRRAFVTLAANGATVSDSAPILPFPPRRGHYRAASAILCAARAPAARRPPRFNTDAMAKNQCRHHEGIGHASGDAG